MTEASGQLVSTAKIFLIGFAAFVVTLAAMVAIPHNRSVRWQAVRTEAYARLGWAYERIHDDPTRLDIALIGTSHTMNGVDGLAVAQGIAAHGVHDVSGRCLTVTNLAIPSYGRNMHWLLTRELLSRRQPKAIVLEVFENETRKPHPLFSVVATTRDIVDAPKLLNTNYVGDLIRLPYRQLELGIQSLAPTEFGLKTAFDPARYDGSTVDNTRLISVHGQAFTPPLTRVMDPRKLEAEAAEIRANKNLSMLPASLAEYEYAVPNRYVGDLLALADAKRIPVYLLYLPGYGQPPLPYDMRLYQGRKILTLNDILARREYWQDVHHLNSQGAVQVSRRLADLLAREMGGPAANGQAGSGAVACDFGYPQAPVTVPFRGGS